MVGAFTLGAVVLAGQLGLFAGTAPADLGVHNGRLKPPSLQPNSVSSETGLYPEHPQKAYAAIAPLRYTGSGEAAMARLGALVRGMERTRVVTQDGSYLYAQSTTLLMHFTDDLEFRLDASASVIQVRSASRLGESDFGVNRARVEKIRAAFGSP